MLSFHRHCIWPFLVDSSAGLFNLSSRTARVVVQPVAVSSARWRSARPSKEMHRALVLAQSKFQSYMTYQACIVTHSVAIEAMDRPTLFYSICF